MPIPISVVLRQTIWVKWPGMERKSTVNSLSSLRSALHFVESMRGGILTCVQDFGFDSELVFLAFRVPLGHDFPGRHDELGVRALNRVDVFAVRR